MTDTNEQYKLNEMIIAIQNADEVVFSDFYEKVVARFYSLASRILVNSADAEEVVCDAFTQIWQQAKLYNVDKGSVIAWCMVIVRSRALDHLRKRNTRTKKLQDASQFFQEVSDEQDEPEKLLQLFQKNSQIGQVIESLSSIQQQLLALSFFKGLTHQEIAETTQMPLGTVKSNIRRALEQLQSSRFVAQLL
ncbi:MAG: RNA polymerase subunit sigma-24 [Kangiella sp.]|nr:MAG: RNA polymerase subunit sigma-24 [Kangiella sp.]